MTLPLRIAHISDLHRYSGLPEGRDLTLKSTLGVASWYLKRRHIHCKNVTDTLLQDVIAAKPDVIALTGDLINFGSETEFGNTADFLRQLTTSNDVLIMPGNHEIMTRWSAGHMHKHWAGFLYKEGEVEFPQCCIYGRYALISVSTAVATPPGFASGKVGAAQRTRLENMLMEAEKRNQFPVVLMHHPPTPVKSRRKGLSDGPEICALLAGSSVKLVLHGHTHKRQLSWINGSACRIPVIGTTALSLKPKDIKAGGSWQLIELDADSEKATLKERRIDLFGKTVSAMTPVTINCNTANKYALV